MKNLRIPLTLILALTLAAVSLTAIPVQAQDPKPKLKPRSRSPHSCGVIALDTLTVIQPAEAIRPATPPANFGIRRSTSTATALTIHATARWKNIATVINKDLKRATTPALIESLLIRVSRTI